MLSGVFRSMIVELIITCTVVRSVSKSGTNSLNDCTQVECTACDARLGKREIYASDLELSLLQTGLIVDRSHAEVSRHDELTALSAVQGQLARKSQGAAIDTQLELSDVLADVCPESDGFQFRGLTSPSFIPVPSSDEVRAVFRGLCLGSSSEFDGVHEVEVWRDHAVLGSTTMQEFHSGKAVLNWTTLTRIQNLTNPSTECLDPERALYAWSGGPEDPKLVLHNSKTYVVFIGAGSVSAKPSAEWGVPNNFTGRPPCKDSTFQPHIAEVISSPPRMDIGLVLPLWFEGMHDEEKNWVSFSYQPNLSEPGELMFVYDMHPHTILKPNMTSGHMRRIYNETSNALARFAQELDAEPSDFHGGVAQAQPTSCADGTACLLSVTHRHIDDIDSSQGWIRRYEHYPYKFSAEPPFDIKELGKLLPLHSAPNPVAPGWHVQFVSSILINDDFVIIGYNTADQNSRTFRIPVDEFESVYFGGATP